MSSEPLERNVSKQIMMFDLTVIDAFIGQHLKHSGLHKCAKCGSLLTYRRPGSKRMYCWGHDGYCEEDPALPELEHY